MCKEPRQYLGRRDISYEDAMLVPIRMGTNMAPVTEFCYKSVNLFLEELINIF